MTSDTPFPTAFLLLGFLAGAGCGAADPAEADDAGGESGEATDAEPDGVASDGDASREDAPPPFDCTFAPDPRPPADPPDPPATTDYLVLAADPLLASAERLAAWRATTGHRTEVIPVSAAADDGTGSPDLDGYADRFRAIVADRRAALPPDRSLLVLLWGDAETTWDGRPDRVPTSVFSDPGGWSDPVTSDNVYVDLDGDDLPDAAVGRVPVRTPAEAEAYVDAVLAYETVWEPGPWNRRLNVFAGIGGFGDLVEDIFLDVGMRIMGELDPAWQVTFVYARQDSPYTWPPPRFSDRVYAYLNAGGLMMSYIGHGSPRGFDTVEWEGGPSGPIFDAARLDDIGIVGRAPVLVFVACSTGSFDTGDCISERILRQPRSSPAILSSTEVSHPYSNTVFIREVERVGFSERPATVGELFLRAKRATAENRDELRDYIDGLASLQMTVEEMEALGPAHLHMYTLFGDPGLRPAWPAGEADVRLDRTWAVRGEPLRVCVQVHGPPSGTARVGFEIQRTDLARWPEPWTLSDPDWEATVTANHESANDKVDWSTEIPYAGGGFELSFVVPATVRARFHHLVVQAGDDASEAIGSTLVRLRPD